MSKNLRIKCPSCGNVADVPGNGNCAKCNNPLVLPEDGVIQMYRMGNPLGMAVGFGIYLNDIPMGHLANSESIRVPVSYGHYKVHRTDSSISRLTSGPVSGPTQSSLKEYPATKCPLSEA